MGKSVGAIESKCQLDKNEMIVERGLVLVFVAFVGYTISLVALNVVAPTDFPYGPEDTKYDIIKVTGSLIIGILCAVQYYKEKYKKK